MSEYGPLPFVAVIGAALLFDYALFIARCIRRSRQTQNATGLSNPSDKMELTVLIPCRNEATNLTLLLKDLSQQSVPVRTVVIDDHSTDESRAIAESFGVKVIDSIGLGKKAALITGYRIVDTPWMATLDADVRLQGNWAACMMHCAKEGTSAAVLGGVAIAPRSKSGWEQFQALEFGSMMVWISGGVATGHLAMGSGANSLYATADYPVDDLNLAQASGDDAFALHSLRKSGKHIGWCGKKDACVQTIPMDSWGALWQQRARWASKTGEQDIETKRTAARVGVLHAFGAILIGMSLTMHTPPWVLLTLAFWLGKGALDGWMIRRASQQFGLKMNGMDALLFPLRYALLVWGAWWQLLAGRVQWKRRSI